MILAKTVEQVRRFRAKLGKKSLGFVPTMGDLHEGHLSLIRRSRKENDATAVSIFVNPTQFNDAKDFKLYRRDNVNDIAALKEEKVDLLFLPSVNEMYPKEFQTEVEVKDLTRGLCGPFRPGHFKGVTTVVAMLFNIVRPDRAYFGMKDFQQLKVIERMVKDLHIPVKIVPCPTMRETSEVALSSRNRRLSELDHARAIQFAKALKRVKEQIRPGRAIDAAKITKEFLSRSGLRKMDVDYLEIIDPETLTPVKRAGKKTRVTAAVWIGETRLIDNR